MNFSEIMRAVACWSFKSKLLGDSTTSPLVLKHRLIPSLRLLLNSMKKRVLLQFVGPLKTIHGVSHGNPAHLIRATSTLTESQTNRITSISMSTAAVSLSPMSPCSSRKNLLPIAPNPAALSSSMRACHSTLGSSKEPFPTRRCFLLFSTTPHATTIMPARTGITPTSITPMCSASASPPS
ncbi:hypothetical protein SAMN00808754_2961 [Thermanaeromonas toyohensis ToBE]|uniref:Uncharacterized protein n=1 Tax=Thermanaeromonas toyohensis ToBE TaxID=698762 RepID=A0A1W1W392_9FIRM|nr:hypothetical protein SAMN00808754_2961 [Thermanaeromonas toyohensis ToBE]